MDAQALMIVKPEDLELVLQNLVALFLVLSLVAGAAGYVLLQAVRALGNAVRAYGARRPFAERQAALFKRGEFMANCGNRLMHRVDRRQFEARRRAQILEWPDLGAPWQ